MARFLAVFAALALLPLARADDDAQRMRLLEQAVEKWLGERDHWAFTQRAVEWEDGQPRERLERYDPSQPGNARWTLLAIDGRLPTAEEHAAWAKKKFRKKKRRFDTPIGDYFDFRDAKVVGEDARVIRYEVPLRNEKQWLFETDKVRVIVSVNKHTRALERLTADVTDPLRVLFGLARITQGALELSFLNYDEDAPPGPETTQPTGRAHVKVSTFGHRAEFTWSDFKRVTPAHTAQFERPRD